MGDINKHKVGLSEALFSKTQRRILNFLFGQPEKSFYSKEIVNLAGVGTGTVHRELENKLGRQINPTIYTDEEFRYKITSENNFVLKIIEQPKIFLIGSKDDIPAV